jgi:hypothetical protein
LNGHHSSLLCLTVLVFFFDSKGAQEGNFGIGMVIAPGEDDMRAVIYTKPNLASDTIATLFRWEYTFHGTNEKVRAFLVGFRKYDYHGLPLLYTTHDSD